VHVLGDDKGGQVALADLGPDQVNRDHPEGVGAGALGGAGDLSHQADVAGAIDQPPAHPGDGGAKGAGGLGMGGVGALARAAKDADRTGGHGDA
jgi:hypothetical protein